MTLIRFVSSNINDIQDKFKCENNELLEEIEKIHTEEIILERIPEISCPPAELIVPKSGLSSSEQNARKYHTKNMTSRYNTVKQRYNKQKYHKTQNRTR